MANKEQLKKDLYSLESQLGDIQKNAPKYEKLSPSQRFKLKQSINDKIRKKKQQLGENQMTSDEIKLREIIRDMLEHEMTEDLFPKNELTPYQKFFKKCLVKYGVNSPDELSDNKKKEFFDYVDANYKAVDEYGVTGMKRGETRKNSAISHATVGKTNSPTEGDKAASHLNKWLKNNSISKKTEEIDEAKEKYSVYDKKTFNIIRNGLTKDAAIKMASKNKNHEYGSEAWVEDNYKEHNKIKESDIDETSASGNAGFYNTPKAFTKPGQDYENSPAAKSMGWKSAKRIDEMAVSEIKPLIGKEAAFKYKKATGEVKTYFGRLVKITGDMLYAGILNKGLRSFKINNILSISQANLNREQVEQLNKMINEAKNGVDEQVDFKNPDFSPRQKMAQAIRTVRESLKEVEKIVDKSRVFKEENNVKSIDMYKRSHAALKRIGEQMNRISNKLQAIK